MIEVPELTQAEYDAAVARAEDSVCAVAFAFDEKSQMIRLLLDNETSIIFPLTMLPALKNATPAQIRNVRFVSDGMDIWWDDLDVQHTVEYIIGKATGTIPSKNTKSKAVAKQAGSNAAMKKKSPATGKRKKVAA